MLAPSRRIMPMMINTVACPLVLIYPSSFFMNLTHAGRAIRGRYLPSSWLIPRLLTSARVECGLSGCLFADIATFFRQIGEAGRHVQLLFPDEPQSFGRSAADREIRISAVISPGVETDADTAHIRWIIIDQCFGVCLSRL